MLVSIVVPARNEEGCLEPLYREVCRVFEQAGEPFELILVNDGSTDATAEVIDRLSAEDERVVGIHLARGFGHQPALLSGIQEACGDVVVTMDADLEQPPSSILDMLASWRDGYQVVHGVRRDHPETGVFKRTSSRWFYKLFTFLSRVPLEPGMLDFRLMDRRVVDAIAELTERDFFLRGIASWIGFRQTRVPYDAGRRAAGQTKYGIRRMVAFALRGITSFSTFPLRLASYLGAVMTVVALAYGGFVAIRHFLWAHPQPGYASIIVAMTFLMGIQFLLIGLLGEYVARIHVEVKRRPRFVVARKTGTRARAEKSVEAVNRAAVPMRRAS